MLKILATSDLHIGLKFAAYTEVQDKLIEARFTVLERLVTRANTENVDLFVIAGDLFDRPGVAKKDVMRIRAIIGEFHGKLAAVLPGNHDFVSSGESNLWSHFDEGTGGNVLVLRKQEPYLLTKYDIDGCIYPGPCVSKHSPQNAIGWIKNTPRVADVSFHIGIAHGSLDGVSPDFNGSYYPMTRKDLDCSGIDCWILGHTHLQWENGAVFYCGTPEPDGFDCSHNGTAWIIDLEKGKAPRATGISPGSYRFAHAHEQISRPEEIETIGIRYSSPEYGNVLLKLILSGRLPRDRYDELIMLRERLTKSVFCLCSYTNQVRKEITPALIDAEFTQGSFPYRLLTDLSHNESDAEALQTAYELITGVKQ